MSEPSTAEVLKLFMDNQERKLADDSIVGSCQCCTKTDDPQHHKPGCKYRLVCERNEARLKVQVLEDEKEHWRVSSVCRDLQRQLDEAAIKFTQVSADRDREAAKVDKLTATNSELTLAIHTAKELIAQMDSKVQGMLVAVENLKAKQS